MTRLRGVGERAVLVEVAHPAAAAAWVRARAAERGLPLVDVVPAARTVLVVAPSTAARDELTGLLDGLPDGLDPTTADAPGETVHIPVRFDGPDLAAVAERAGIDVPAVVRLMVAAEFVADFCGFAPGFAYLSGLPAALHGPRRAEPRTRVPTGSLAVADGWAAVYPRASPGGWQLLGTTDTVLFDADRHPPALLVAGTRVRFEERR